MYVRNPAELGHLIRRGRLEAGLTQQRLADLLGVSRQWVVKVEKGTSMARIGLVFRALGAVHQEVSVTPIKPSGLAIDLNLLADGVRYD